MFCCLFDIIHIYVGNMCVQYKQIKTLIILVNIYTDCIKQYKVENELFYARTEQQK